MEEAFNAFLSEHFPPCTEKSTSGVIYADFGLWSRNMLLCGLCRVLVYTCNIASVLLDCDVTAILLLYTCSCTK